MTSIDIDQVRSDTSGCSDVVHLNNAGASLSPDVVVAATIEYLQQEASIGGYHLADRRADDLALVYRAGAQLLGCDPGELAFQTSAGEAWWRAFSAVPLEEGDTILTGRSEYIANGIGMIQAEERGIKLDVIPNDEHGQIDLDALARRLDDSVKLVCLTHVPMTSGLVNPAAEVGRLAKEAGAFYLLDACQAVGQLPVDVDELRCDFLALTGRKWLRGPRGTGLLYARSAVLPHMRAPIFTDGRSATWTGPREYELSPGALRYEFGEVNYAAKVGLGVAIQYALDVGIDAIAARVGSLADRLRSELPSVAGVSVYDQGREKCGIVTFTVAGRETGAVVADLRRRGINLAGPTSGTSWLDIGEAGIGSVVRASPHYFNTDDEIDALLTALASPD